MLMELKIAEIQEALKNLLRTQVVATLTIKSGTGTGGLGVSVAKAACAAAGIPEDEVRAVVDRVVKVFGDRR